MFQHDQGRAPKYKVQLGMSDNVIIHLNEDENSVQKKVLELKELAVFCQNTEAEKISVTGFSISIPRAFYVALQKLYSYPESKKSKYGISQFRAKQFTFSNIEKAWEFHQCLKALGFKPLEAMSASDDDVYVVRTPHESGKIFDSLLPCFTGQGSLDNYLALDEFYRQILAKHEGIFTNTELSNNLLVKQLHGIFGFATSAEDKLSSMWWMISEFKTQNAQDHTDLIHPGVNALISDIEKALQLKVDMSQDEKIFRSQLTLEPRANTDKTVGTKNELMNVIDLETHISTDSRITLVVKEENPSNSANIEKTPCEKFFEKHKEFLNACGEIADDLRILLNEIFVNKEVSDEGKLKLMYHLVLEFQQKGMISIPNLQSYPFTEFSSDLFELASQLNQTISSNTAQLFNNEHVVQPISSSSSSTSSTSSVNAPSDLDSDSLVSDLFGYSAMRGTFFIEEEAGGPTEYPLTNGETLSAKRPYDEMTKTDSPKLEDDNISEEGTEETHDEKRRKLNGGDFTSNKMH